METEDFVKNLFKLLCGVLNMTLKQRGHNQMPRSFLRQFLDGIDFASDDPEVCVLNQLVTLKNLANRKAFSLTDQQFVELHEKFGNLSEQRMNPTAVVEPEPRQRQP